MTTKTCADCIHHTCKSNCVFSKYLPKLSKYCSGHCALKHTHKTCYGVRCKEFQLDPFYKEDYLTHGIIQQVLNFIEKLQKYKYYLSYESEFLDDISARFYQYIKK